MMGMALSAFALVLGLGANAETMNTERIASLNLAADEVLLELLAPGRLVSVTKWADAAETSNVAGRVPASVYRFPKADMERLVALRPDLVVVSEYTDADFLDLVQRSGMRVHRMQGLSSLMGIRRAILDLGKAVGAEERAAGLVDRFDGKLADLKKRLDGSPRPRLLYWSSGMTAGAGTAIGTLIECGGATNLGRELGVEGIAPVGAERAFAADPDAILVGTWPLAEESIKEHPLLSKLRCVREGHIVTVPTPLLVALSQYAADACVYLAHELHPDRVPKP
jgi:iron complex transport system substrate-binding protein